MNLNAIKRCCADTKWADIITDGNGDQWICNLAANYRISGIKLDDEGLVALFDLTDKQKGEWTIREDTTDDRRLSAYPDDGDEPLEWIGSVMLGDAELCVLEGARGILMVNRALLKPTKEKYRRLFLRTWEGHDPAVAVFEDVMCTALVMPISGYGEATTQALCEKIVGGPWIVPIESGEKQAANAEAAAERMMEATKE